MARFKIRDKRSPSTAREMLLVHLHHGQGANARKHYDLSTEAGVSKLLTDHGYGQLKQVVKDLRPRDTGLPFETYVGFGDFGPTLKANLSPGSRMAIRGENEEEVASLEGESGSIVTSAYKARFRDSVTNLNRCIEVEEPRYGDLLSCFADGMASIEAFVNYRTQRHRQALPRGNERIVELDFKIFDWIPRLYGGITVDKGYRNWQNFEKIRCIRNSYASHPDIDVYRTSDSEFCEQLNLWRTGIAELLLNLHVTTKMLVPPDIVKQAYLPEIEVDTS